MYLATEDELSEAVGLKLAREAGISIEFFLRKNGNGYLRSQMRSFVKIATRSPVIVFTDLDDQRCPLALIRTWLGNLDPPRNLIFRVVVKEIESWILADHVGLSTFLSVPSRYIPDAPETVPDAKRALLAVAGRAPRNIRHELVAERGSIASQGLGYNSLLAEFVRGAWDSQRAAERAPSLASAMHRLSELGRQLQS